MKRMRTMIIMFGCMMLVFIVLLQFLRIEKIYQIISPVSAEEKNIQLMDTSTEPSKGSELSIFVAEGSNDHDKKLESNIQYALTYAKVNYKTIKAADISSISPSPYNLLVLTSENSDQYPLPFVTNFVQQGGRLIITTRLEGSEWDSLTGIKENRGFYSKEVFGMHFEKTIFPGYPNLDKEAAILSNSMLDVTLMPEAQIYITAEKHPMLWTYNVGQGKVVYWNATSLDNKIIRGLLLHSIGLAAPAFVTGQVAAKGLHIDDFPAPVPEGASDSITKQYDMSISDFFKKIWWTDMKSFAHQFDLIYTAYIIGTYRNDDTLDAGAVISLDEGPYLYYGRELLSMGGELGLHGYNHQPLVTANEPIDPSLRYRVWDGSVQMREGLKKVETAFNHFFPEFKLKSYVPPSNIINETGIGALSAELPDINNISSVYTGDSKLGNLVQEFEFDKSHPNIYHMPRISSGYAFTEEAQLMQVDAIANFGMFQHFIHPDDLLDPKRIVGNGWSDMKADFAKMLKQIYDIYPYLEAHKSSVIRDKMIAYEQSKVNIRYTDKSISVSGKDLLLPSVFIVRVGEGKELDLSRVGKGAEITKMKDVEGLYLVKMLQPQLEIQIK
jgi:hypothetical protein